MRLDPFSLAGADVHSISLVHHPATPSQAVHAIEARVLRFNDGRVALKYRLTGQIARLRIPPVKPPRHAQRLWQHTCFEAFISMESEAEYTEYNFAPSGEWAIYRFTACRSGMRRVENSEPPEIVVRRGKDFLELDSIIRLPGAATLELGLSAVVEDENGELSYWALKHPRDEPDFHHRDSFALAI